MKTHYRAAIEADIPALARIRAAEGETESYWQRRIARYMDLTNHSQHALKPRIVYVAEQHTVIGFAAGHLTRRFDCEGEVEWINVAAGSRGGGIADELLSKLAAWFVERHARRICVDVMPQNMVARRFYMRHGAREFKPSWLLWEDIGVVCPQ